MQDTLASSFQRIGLLLSCVIVMMHSAAKCMLNDPGEMLVIVIGVVSIRTSMQRLLRSMHLAYVASEVELNPRPPPRALRSLEKNETEIAEVMPSNVAEKSTIVGVGARAASHSRVRVCTGGPHLIPFRQTTGRQGGHQSP